MKKQFKFRTWHFSRCLLIHELITCKTKIKFIKILKDAIKIKKLEEKQN